MYLGYTAGISSCYIFLMTKINFQYQSIQNQIKKKNTFLMTKMSYVGKIKKFQIVERKYQTFYQA